MLLKAIHDSDAAMQQYVKDVCASIKRLDERIIVDLLTTRSEGLLFVCGVESRCRPALRWTVMTCPLDDMSQALPRPEHWIARVLLEPKIDL